MSKVKQKNQIRRILASNEVSQLILTIRTMWGAVVQCNVLHTSSLETSRNRKLIAATVPVEWAWLAFSF